MRVICCQWNLVWENKSANFEKVRGLLRSAQAAAGSLVVLPEMFSTGFSMNVGQVQEGNPSETEDFLREVAKEWSVYVLAGLVAAGEDGRARNQAVAISPEGQLLARYSKIHPFSLGGESACYAAGTEVVLFRWQGLTVAPIVCYDLRFPEVFRTAVRRGAQLFAVMANWPIKREMHWVTLLQARAIENQAYVVGVNRCGTDLKFTYPGRTLVVDPHGKVLADAGQEELALSVEVDPQVLESWRKEFPALQDMHWNS
jgi:omega-amidase